jgi:hypothetical protein
MKTVRDQIRGIADESGESNAKRKSDLTFAFFSPKVLCGKDLQMEARTWP